jgi:cation transport ATPase
MIENRVVHETTQRMRLRLASGVDLADARVSFEQVPGVTSVRVAPAARSITVHHNGRRATRHAILERLATLKPSMPRKDLPKRAGETIPIEAPLLAAALTPMLPPAARPVVAVALVAGKAYAAWRKDSDLTATALDSVALVTTALTGHPLTATTSVLLSAVAERRRDRLLARTDRLLANLAPAPEAMYSCERAGEMLQLRSDELQVGDRVALRAGWTVPVDGVVVRGRAELTGEPLGEAPTRWVERGARVASGARVLSGVIELGVERPTARSRAARLHDHIRHALRTRDTPGVLTPDLERLVAVPVTAGGLVLALTGDAGLTASMLQADPQQGIALANPVAREAALYAAALNGVLLTGLDSLERLASATTFAFEDVGVLTERYWHIERVIGDESDVDVEQARRWLNKLAGFRHTEQIEAGLPDDQVAAWREHGAVLLDHGRVLHVGGAALLARTWDLKLQEPDRRSLVRRLGVVEAGRLLATIHLGCPLRDGVRQRFAQLRALGVRRIAVFTEDPGAQPAQSLLGLGADTVVSSDRPAQERWLDEAVERGERVALVHTGLRDLLPAGGLSLCPSDAEAGAHGVLLGDPLASLLAARRAARTVRRALRRHFGRSVVFNSALMVAAAMRWLPPPAIAAIKHAFAFLLLEESARLARIGVHPPPPTAAEAPEARETVIAS